MAEPKTRPNGRSVTAFLDAVEDPQRRKDFEAVARTVREATGKRAKLWGDSIVGYDRFRYRHDSGRAGDWFVTGFSPRKGNLTLYVMAGFDRYADLMAKFGKHRTGKG